MLLTKIQIENFRSIKSQTIIFDHNCLILIGKNEAGKSNILKAVAAVFDQYEVFDKDRRKRIDNEKIDEYYIRAIIKLQETDFDKILKRFQQKYTNIECITFSNNQNLQNVIKSIFRELLIQIDIGDEKNTHFSYWNYDKNKFSLEKEIYLDGNSFNTEKTGIKETDIISLIYEEIKELYKEDPYKCYYWEYSDENLLPSSITINTFKNKPSTCLPLKNVFILSDRENISDEFTNSLKEDRDYENLLEQVSKKATQTFRDIWQDFKGTSIELRSNGPEMLIKIVNKAKYSCDDRSDGFKKFISILLMLSTQARSNMIGERDIILIDEPDQSLYPTSARYLRDELLKIAEKAKIIYSTHSTYMIDSNCIERHLIVEKKDDITTISKQDKNAEFCNDELLRRAIGSSIFECLQDKNIIFEGWLDKELFQKYCSFHKKANDFKNIGNVYLGGISGVETLVQLLILANKKFVIVADSDRPSNDKRKEFEKNYEEYSKTWLAYADVAKDVSTMEDFLTSTYIEEIIKIKYSDFTYDKEKNAIKNIEIVSNNNKDDRQKIKNDLIKKIKAKDIKSEYEEFVKQLKSKIDQL